MTKRDIWALKGWLRRWIVGFVSGWDALLVRFAAIHFGGQGVHRHRRILPRLYRPLLDSSVDGFELILERQDGGLNR